MSQQTRPVDHKQKAIEAFKSEITTIKRADDSIRSKSALRMQLTLLECALRQLIELATKGNTYRLTSPLAREFRRDAHRLASGKNAVGDHFEPMIEGLRHLGLHLQEEAKGNQK
ncbi:hypothetical protein [Shimazuella kribbensis]|uniref:hypothetical protein n=1 Tax=Shimazuella kribbensis TaxID=139808 RepID=UPI000415675B|nr:hypothetical protein [Shimazuella kribbensis]